MSITHDQYAGNRRYSSSKHESRSHRNVMSPAMKAGLAVAGIALAAEAGHLYVNHHHEQETKARVEALAAAHDVANGVVVLEGGSNLRKTTAVQNGTPDNGMPNNLERTTGKSKVTIITNPRIVEAGGDTWIGFTSARTDPADISSIKSLAEHTVWADLTELEAEGKAMTYAHEDQNWKTYRIQLAEDGSTTALEGKDGKTVAGPIATSMELEQEAWQDFKQLDLNPASASSDR